MDGRTSDDAENAKVTFLSGLRAVSTTQRAASNAYFRMKEELIYNIAISFLPVRGLLQLPTPMSSKEPP
jgi:hypothetical protein